MNWAEHLKLKRFFIGEPPTDQPVTLTHRRIFILPSRSGWGFALSLAIGFLIATNYNNSLAFLLVFLLASMTTLSALYTFRNLAGLTVRRGRGNPVFAGNPALFELIIENPNQLARTYVEVRTRREAAVRLDWIGPKDFQKVVLSAPTERRGYSNLGPVTLITRYPLGLFKAWAPFDLNFRVLVYPTPWPDPIPFPTATDLTGEGSASINDGEFSGFRSYQPGDSLSRVNWRSLAKGQPLSVREESSGYRSEKLSFDWDSAPGRDAEERLRVLCRWIVDAEASNTSYSLSLPGFSVAPSRGSEHFDRCLTALATFGI